MCKYFKAVEGQNVIGWCSKIEQEILCAGDMSDCECLEAIREEVSENLEETTLSADELLEEMRNDIKDLKRLANEILSLVDDTDIIDLIDGLNPAKLVADTCKHEWETKDENTYGITTLKCSACGVIKEYGPEKDRHQ